MNTTMNDLMTIPECDERIREINLELNALKNCPDSTAKVEMNDLYRELQEVNKRKDDHTDHSDNCWCDVEADTDCNNPCVGLSEAFLDSWWGTNPEDDEMSDETMHSLVLGPRVIDPLFSSGETEDLIRNNLRKYPERLQEIMNGE